MPAPKAPARPRGGVRAPGLIEALRVRYAHPAWALFPEVADATGFDGSRRADAIAMGLWPSLGLEIHGFELKCSRTDWRRELADPQKHRAVGRYCDRWWLVVSNAALVHDGELPDDWGMLAHDGEALRLVVEAPPRAAVPIDRAFLAALARAAYKSSPAEANVRERLRLARQSGLFEGGEKARREKQAEIERLDEKIHELREENLALRLRLLADKDVGDPKIGG